jgi:nitric oxide reductase large subunit
MLQYKPVTVERLICTCDRCGSAVDKEQDMMEWQERFIVSFRAGYGSVFGDGNYVEGDFCQECIQTVLGKWLRVIDDNPFEPNHRPANEAEKLLQTYQHDKHQESQRKVEELTDLFKGGHELAEKRKQIADHFGVPDVKVTGIALDYLLQSIDSKKSSDSVMS